MLGSATNCHVNDLEQQVYEIAEIWVYNCLTIYLFSREKKRKKKNRSKYILFIYVFYKRFIEILQVGGNFLKFQSNIIHLTINFMAAVAVAIVSKTSMKSRIYADFSWRQSPNHLQNS